MACFTLPIGTLVLNWIKEEGNDHSHHKTLPRRDHLDGPGQVKLIYFTRDHSPHDDRFLKVLSKSGHQALLLRLQGGPLASRGIHLPEGISEIAWPGLDGMEVDARIEDLVCDLQKLIADIQPDLIHAGPLPDCAYLAALAGYKPLVGMSWGFDLLHDVDESNETRKKAVATLENSQALLVDCEASAGKAAQLGFAREKIVNFPWGVDLEHFSPGEGSTLRRQLGWEKNFVILCNRSWEPKYGVDLLLKAFLDAFQQNPNLRLLLVGDGSQAAEIEKMIRGSGAGTAIHHPGRIGLDDLPDSYRASDLFASASHVDGSSVSLLEAMACGRAVAVSSIPANLEWVKNGENGWVFTDGDGYGLTDVLLEAAADPYRCASYGGKNRLIAETRANWQKNSTMLFDAYQMAMESAR